MVNPVVILRMVSLFVLSSITGTNNNFSNLELSKNNHRVDSLSIFQLFFPSTKGDNKINDLFRICFSLCPVLSLADMAPNWGNFGIFDQGK